MKGVEYDMKDRTISGVLVVCEGCRRELKNDDTAYVACTDKKVFCKSCLLQGTVNQYQSMVSSGWDKDNSVYYWGTVKILKKVKP